MGSILRSPAISEQPRKLANSTVTAPASTAASLIMSSSQPARIPSQAQMAADDHKRVQQLVMRAREEALAEARTTLQKEAESVREQARQQGLNEGREAGAKKAQQELDATIHALQLIAKKIPQAIEAGVKGIEDIAVAIAYEACCKMVGDMSHLRPGIQALVRQAAAQAAHAECAAVRLGSYDFATLREANALDAVLHSGLQVRWVADDGITDGGCIIEMAGGDIDARLITQFDRLRQTLLAARNEII